MPYINNKMWSLAPNLPDFADLEIKCLALSDKVNPQDTGILSMCSADPELTDIKAMSTYVWEALKKYLEEADRYLDVKRCFKLAGEYISTSAPCDVVGSGMTAILVLNCGAIYFVQSGEIVIMLTIEDLTLAKRVCLARLTEICSAAQKHVYKSAYNEMEWDISSRTGEGYVCEYTCTFSRKCAVGQQDLEGSKQCNTQKEVEMLLGNQTKEGTFKAVKSLDDAPRIRVANDKVLMPLINQYAEIRERENLLRATREYFKKYPDRSEQIMGTIHSAYLECNASRIKELQEHNNELAAAVMFLSESNSEYANQVVRDTIYKYRAEHHSFFSPILKREGGGE